MVSLVSGKGGKGGTVSLVPKAKGKNRMNMKMQQTQVLNIKLKTRNDMKKLFALLVGAVTVLGLTGCFEQAGLLNVDKDGSGTLKLRMYMSTQMMEQMNSLGGLAGGLGGEPAEVPDPMEQFKSQLKEQGEASGATFVSGKDVKNKAGWSGYEATFKFADVTKLVLGEAVEGADDAGAGGPQMDMGQVKSRFEFIKGDVATLKIIGLDASGAEDEKMSDEEMARMGEMLGMVKPRLAGMRATLMVRVNGEIVETNAKFRPGNTGNQILMAELQMDKLLEDPKAFDQLLQTMKKTQAADLPGLKMEDPTRPTVIKFK